MFGEYAQVASYIQPARTAAYKNDVSNNELPFDLNPIFHPPQPWDQARAKSGLGEDFIMIAEFSELEGPKPLMTIPKDGGANFDQNSFAVRILAVDHHNPTEGFSISEDAQIVVTDAEAGVFAFVHHMVLYDNTARGFVRPYCIAFITAEQRKLMQFYEELSWKFKKVARFLKYGNKMVFVGDLERHLKDLEYTKNVLLNQVCKMRLRSSEGPEDQITDARKNAENELYRGLQTIQQSSLEIKEILSILKPLLPDRRLEARFKILEDRAYQGYSSVGLDKMSLPESGFTEGFSAVDELDFRYGSLTEPRISPLAVFKPREYKPVLVETKKAKRFNAPLRGLHELCSWGAKEGLRKLRYIHMYFKRDMVILDLHRNERRLFRPRCTGIYHGQCITGNLLSGMQMKKFHDATEEAEHNWSMLYSHPWSSSMGSLESEDSFKSADSFTSGNDYIQASPTSFHTYDSLNGNVFQSVSASPEKEFSLLMSNEYYPDLTMCQEEEKSYTESNNVFHKEKPQLINSVDKILMDTDGDSPPKHMTISSRNEDTFSEKIPFGDIKNNIQFDNQMLTVETACLRKDTLSDSGTNSSALILEATISGKKNNNLMCNVNMIDNKTSNFNSNNETMNMSRKFPLIKDELIYKINNSNPKEGSNVEENQWESKSDSLEDKGLKNRDDLSVCEDLNFTTYNNYDGIAANARSLADASHSVELVEENIDKSLSLNDAKSHQDFSDNIFTSHGHDDGQSEGKPELLPRNRGPDSEDCLSSGEDNSHPAVVHVELMVAASSSQGQQHCGLLLAKFEQEQSLQGGDRGFGLSVQVNLFSNNCSIIPPQNGSEIPLQNSLEIPPQNGSEMSNHNGTEHSNNLNKYFSGTKNLQSVIEILPNDSEISLKDNEILQNDSEMSMKNNEILQNGPEISMKDDEILQNVSEIQQNGSEIPQDLALFLEDSQNDSMSNENKLPPETNEQLAHHGLKKIIYSSKLSHSLGSDHRQFDHHITRVTLLRGERFHHLGFNIEDELTRTRTESDVSSTFTEISLQDLYQNTNCSETASKDGTSYEGHGTTVVDREPNDIVTVGNTTFWKPRCGAYTIGDWINNLSQYRPGFGLSEVLLTYQYLEHVIFSLLCGRPVLVAGPAKMEQEVIKIVNALAVFVPVARRKYQTVLEWTSKPLKITDLVKLKLIGICRPDKRSLDSFVPSAIKKACTVVDIEKKTILAPPYQGQFIAALMSKRNVLRSDVQLLTYVEWWLMGIMAKAFIFFHNFCLGPKGSVLYSQSPKDQRDGYNVIVSGIMSRLGVQDCDCDIVENFTEMVKLSRMEFGSCQGVDSGFQVSPLTLKNKTCERFRCR